MDEKKTSDRPRDQWGKTEREEGTGSAWKASPGLSTPGPGPDRGPPNFDYRTEAEEHLGEAPSAEAASIGERTTVERTEVEFTLEGASVGGGPAVPPEGAVSGAYRKPGSEIPREANVDEKQDIGSEAGSGVMAGAKERLAGAKEKLSGAKELGSERLTEAKDTVREKASDLSSRAARTARSQVDQHKGQVADRLEGLQGQLHERVGDKAEDLANQFTTRADEYLTKATHLLREKNSDELMQMARDEFRARPLAVAGGFFALGFIGARLLRS